MALADPDMRNYASTWEYQGLNPEQREVVDGVFAALDANPQDDAVPRLFFMNGAGGVGKTHVYNVIVKLCLTYRIRALVTATTGVAATLLPMGSTLHSAFRLPLDNLNEQQGATVKIVSTLARRIIATQVLIIDEVTMLRQEYLSIIDVTCRDLLPANDPASKLPFGGKVVLLGGDWQQLLPIVPHENVIAQAAACVKSSALFPRFHTFRLVQNMRVLPNEVEFLEMLSEVGRGEGPTPGRFTVPDHMRAFSLDELVDFVYLNGQALTNMHALRDCLLLALKRSEVQLLNERILGMLNGQSREYLSADSALNDNPLDIYAAVHSVPALNAIDVADMPPHRLVLKVGAIIVLIRNIDVHVGLSNGTRMMIQQMGQFYLDCVIVAGPHRGKQHTLMNYSFKYEQRTADGSGVRMTRFQMPVTLAFAMTVNKAQGQTVGRLGLYLRDEVFSHGQLYVALSRVRSADSLRVYKEGATDPNEPLEIDNMVLRSLL